MQNFAIIVVPAFADCPAHYLSEILSLTPTTNAVNRHTTDPARALLFPTREEAAAVVRSLDEMLWPHATVEARDVPRQTLATDDDLCEVRDAATLAYTESFNGTDREPELKASAAVVQAIQDLGLTGCVEVRPGASCPLTVYIADHLGNTAQLDWDPMQDGFDIPEATCLADGEPMRQFCDGCERLTPVEDIVESGNADIGYFGYCSSCRASHAR